MFEKMQFKTHLGGQDVGIDVVYITLLLLR